MSISLNEAKIELIVNHCVEAMLAATEQGYTFDSITLAPYTGVVDTGDGDGVHYYLWIRDASGMLHLGRTGYIALSQNSPVPKEEALAHIEAVLEVARQENTA